jgi:ribose 1,5-bisphosphate isomerase
MLARITGADNTSVSHMQKIARDLEKKIYDEMEQSKGLIADYGSQLILNGSRCYTHCHSSTVTGIFKEAYDDGKDFSVVVSETRPLFQGLKTAKELSSHGIPTTLIVDSAASVYLKKCDCVLVGADAVSASGDLVNKIGTSTIAHFSAVYGIPFYCAAELYKFDHLTKWGMIEPIEHRNSDEVYKGAKSKLLSIDNLAFDLTPARYISAYVTEKGIIPPQSLLFLTK